MNKMYRVISPRVKKDGSKFWIRLGSAYTNRDGSINVYLDALPVPSEGQTQLQLRPEDQYAGGPDAGGVEQ